MKFEVLGPDLSVANVIESDANPIRIGKSASCEVCIDGAKVGRVHAQLDKVGDVYKISDRLSTGGTFVNGTKVETGKPVVVEDGATLMFGDVQVRVFFGAGSSASAGGDFQAGAEIVDDLSFEDEETPGGSTMAMEMPSLEEIANGNVEDIVKSGTEASHPAPSAPPSAPRVSHAAPPSAPPAPAVSLSKSSVSDAAPAAPAFAKPAAPAAGGFGGGFAASSAASGPVRKKIIRTKKRATSFERRFLSARGKTNALSLEVAMVWRDTVLSIKQYKGGSVSEISVGAGNDCTYQVETNYNNNAKISILRKVNNGWELLFNNQFQGFVLQGDKKTEFSAASTAEFAVPSTGGNLAPGSLACPLDGDVRAKFVFGEVSILVHYVDTVPFALPLLSGTKLTDAAPLLASLILHFALFSVIFFATDRVNALMVDRIITSSRFAVVVEQPQEEDKEEEKLDEEEPPEEEPDDSEQVEVGQADTVLAPTASADSNSSGQSMGRAAAEGAAMQTGLLAQANAMNSMLSAGLDVNNLDNLDWASFDANAAAATAGYGIGATGAGGGGAGLGGFGAGGFGPGGGGGRGGAIVAASRKGGVDLGGRSGAQIAVKMKDPTVSGTIDKRIIQKVVRQHTGELRACYEKELSKVKGLHGRILVNWIISPQGSVTTAFVKETSMNNKNVENCIVNSIKFWRFPSPKGGGMAKVEYPFVFELGSN